MEIEKAVEDAKEDMNMKDKESTGAVGTSQGVKGKYEEVKVQRKGKHEKRVST